MTRAVVLARESRDDAEAELAHLRGLVADLIAQNFELYETLEVASRARCNIKVC